MGFLRFGALALLACVCALSATFGTVVTVIGGAADIVLDEARSRIYLVNTIQNRIEVYSIADRRPPALSGQIATGRQPLAAALSRDGKYLYVTAYEASALDVIDLDALAVQFSVSLPARPEGVAVGADERVLISTIGAGVNNSTNVLVIFDPAAGPSGRLTAVPVTPPAPAIPQVSQPSGRPSLASRSFLQASPDGSLIVGVNLPNTAQRVVFVYESASGAVLASRTVGSISSVVSVSPDNRRFMSGLSLFDTRTLEVLAQQNAANAPYPIAVGTNFNTQQNQGGSVFSPDGSVLYSAFNIAPLQNPPARPNVSQLMLNDPENLLIRTALQLPENLAGKMVTNSDGSVIYALSESGFMVLPVGTMTDFPIATAESTVVLLANDQCGTVEQRQASVTIRNEGRGRLTASAQVLQMTPTGPAPIGGAGGAGGGTPGGPVVIPVPPVRPEPGQPVPPPTLPGGTPTPANPAIAATAPTVRLQPSASGVQIDFGFTNSAAARAPGTVPPTHTFLIQSNEAINIPASVRVFQNYRDVESRGEIVAVPVGLSANEALEDLVLDSRRQRLYIANSGMNRVEVFDTRARRLLAPVRVGQLPRSLAMTPDGNTLYVANQGGESVSIVDLDTLRVRGRVRFPPLPFNVNAPLVTPLVIAAGARYPLVLMSNGTLWKIIGDEAVPPRTASPLVGNLAIPGQFRTMAATPGGEYVLILASNANVGTAYLYDALADDFVASRQLIAANQTGFYFGPIAAGPGGQYYVVNNMVLNRALTPVTPAVAGTRPVSAVAAAGPNSFVRFSQPVRANANAVATEFPVMEVLDVNTGAPRAAAQALEGAVSTLIGNTRVNVGGRTMAMDMATNTAYAITTSGISVVSFDPQSSGPRPQLNQGGIVSAASYVPAFAPGTLMSIFGRDLADAATASSLPLPTVMSGVCVTLNNQPVPLFMTSAGQINAQIPPEFAAGRYTVMVRSADRKLASGTQQINVTRYAPAVFVDPETRQAAIFHRDGQPVTKNRPAGRDDRLVMYAVGLGVTKGGRVTAGNAAPLDPLAVTDAVKVFFGNPALREAEMVVEWSGLVPGLVGVYQLNLYVPWYRMQGDALPVTIRIGGVDSQKEGPAVPTVAVRD